MLSVCFAGIPKEKNKMHRIGQVDDENNDHNDVHDKCLVVSRTLNIQMRDDFDNQKTNIFHSRCCIKGNLCSLIIDSGSCSNVVSSYLVDSLKLPCIKHPNPYHLQWLNECSEVKVTK